MIHEGKTGLKSFCDASAYDYDEELVDKILMKEKQLQDTLNLSTKNVLRYPKVRLVLAKLVVAWFSANMLYFGIMFTPTPDVLMNNFILGLVSTTAGPLMCILMKSRFSDRRTLLGTLFTVTGLAILIMTFMVNQQNVVSLIFGSISYGIMSGAFRKGVKTFTYNLKLWL